MASLCFVGPNFHRSWLFLVLMFVFGCGAIPTPEAQSAPSAQSALETGPKLDSPYVIRVCVKQPGVPENRQFWSNDDSGRLVLDDWELGLRQRNGQRIYYFDHDANPESARMLPIPHNALICAERTPSVLSSNGKSRAKREPEVQKTQKTAAPTNTAQVAAPPPCANSTEPGQTRGSRSTKTHSCTRPKTLIAPTRTAQVAKSEQQQSPTLAQAVPQPAPTPLPLDDWNVAAPNLSGSGLDAQRVIECVGNLCHARHPNFVKKGGKAAAAGSRESRSLSTGGGGGGAKTPNTRKPPTGPKPAQTAKPAAKPAAGSAGGPDAGKPFTRRQKVETQSENAAANGGQTRCTSCSQPTVPAQQSQKGVTPPKNESHTDHIIPKARGGNTSPGNRQVLCRDCNLRKGDRISK